MEIMQAFTYSAILVGKFNKLIVEIPMTYIVVNCHNRQHKGCNFSFCRFPVDQDRYRRWVAFVSCQNEDGFPGSLYTVTEFALTTSFCKRNQIHLTTLTMCHQYNHLVAAKALNECEKKTSSVDLKGHRDDPECWQTSKSRNSCRL